MEIGQHCQEESCNQLDCKLIFSSFLALVSSAGVHRT